MGRERLTDLRGPGQSLRPRRPGMAWATAAFILGTVFAAVSAYWGLGGTGLLDTIGGRLAEAGRSGSPALIAVVWLTVLLKLIAAVLPLVVVGGRLPNSRSTGLIARLTEIGAWTTAVILTVYGGLLTIGGLLVVTDVIHAGPTADLHAIRWHAFFWDPWFLVWGLCAGAAMFRWRKYRPIRTRGLQRQRRN